MIVLMYGIYDQILLWVTITPDSFIGFRVTVVAVGRSIYSEEIPLRNNLMHTKYKAALSMADGTLIDGSSGVSSNRKVSPVKPCDLFVMQL